MPRKRFTNEQIAFALRQAENGPAANASHGSAPNIAGLNIANPLGLLLSAAALLDWHSGRAGQEAFRTAARAIGQAVNRVLTDPATRTGDLSGSASTSTVVEPVAGFIARRRSTRPAGRGVQYPLWRRALYPIVLASIFLDTADALVWIDAHSSRPSRQSG